MKLVFPVSLFLTHFSLIAQETNLEHCLGLADQQRLACYDEKVIASQKQRLLAQNQETAPVLKLTDTIASEFEPEVIPLATVLHSLWELDTSDKRGTFRVRTYQPNYFLPAHYSSSVNQQPQSPTRQGAAFQENYKNLEAKFQVSLRAKVLEDWLLPNADLWFAYTQTSMWQLWNSLDSAPFRSTDYQPEVMYVIPTLQYFNDLPFGWNMQMVRLGFAHQSNGQSEPLSRSWNRFYVGAAFEREQVGVAIKFNKRIPEKETEDDNPDLTDFRGTTELLISWLPGSSTAVLTRRMNWSDFSKGSWQLDYTYPVDREKPDGLRLHLQLFSGYSETLLDYNHRQNSIGLGFMLFNF